MTTKKVRIKEHTQHQVQPKFARCSCNGRSILAHTVMQQTAFRSGRYGYIAMLRSPEPRIGKHRTALL